VTRWDQKKQETREALVRVATDLFEEQGFSATTVQQIARAAEVSERTFFRYFDSKDDLLLEDLIAFFQAVKACLLERPLDEVPLDSLLEATLAAVGSPAGRALLHFVGAIDVASLPGSSRLVRVFVGWEDHLAEVFLDRFASAGADKSSADVQLRAGVIARVGVAAVRVAIRTFRTTRVPGRRSARLFAETVTRSFAIVTEGCQAPTTEKRQTASRITPARGSSAGRSKVSAGLASR